MKQSSYNMFFDYLEDNYIAYNSFTNSLAIIEKELKCKLDKGIEFLDIKEVEDLKYGGFIIDDTIDELDIIKLNMYKERFNTEYMSLTIAPTLMCNFRCIYCYEKNQDDSYIMSNNTQDSLLEFISSKISGIRNLDVTWYGGEPLLAIDVIERLSSEIKDMCNKNNVQYSSGIITNAYLLDEVTCKKLKDANVSFIQITLDGTRDIHDSRRMLKNNKGTFDIILNKIKKIKKFGFSISIRVNVDIDNKDNYFELIELLKKENVLEYTEPYMAIVTPTNDRYNIEKCFRDEKALENKYLAEKYTREIKESKEYKYPNIKFSYCGADSLNSFVIEPRGNVVSCWDDIGYEDKVIFNIEQKEFYSINKTKYLLYDVTEDVDCKKCKCLPICMGGCPHKRLEGKKECDESYENLERSLRDFVTSRAI